MESNPLTGGCLCRAVRYRLDEAPTDAGYCHCRFCQRASGAPAMAFGTISCDAFVLTRGDPQRHRSSDIAERWFCGTCGSPLAIHADYQADTIDIALASLDDPSAVAPGFHIWCSRKISWFETADIYPRYERFRPDTRGTPQEAQAMSTPRSGAQSD